MRVLVCGGRDYLDRSRLNAVLDRLHVERGFTLVIAGGARGADTLAAEWAASRGILFEIYIAAWETEGRKAGPLRNFQMLEEGRPGLVVGFPGGRGTAHMCRIAREAGVEVIEIAPALYLICDEPSPWATLQESQDHLAELRKIPDPYSPSVKCAIDVALETIRQLEARES
jgi:predicted Rossmann-fold nucleotide-binding protein